MQTISQRILDYLNLRPEGVDDDELAAALGIKQRQSANIVCRRLSEQRLMVRRKVDGKIRNFALADALPSPALITPLPSGERAWFWEGVIIGAN